MTGFELDPERLAASGSALQSVSARLSAELTAFQAELAGYGAPWGSDDIGSLIGAAHDEVSSYAFECYRDALDEIQEAGRDVVVMSTRYVTAEQDNTDRFGELHARLDG